MLNNKVLTASAIAVIVFLTAGAFAIGQRSTSFNFLGMSGTCIDTTVRH